MAERADEYQSKSFMDTQNNEDTYGGSTLPKNQKV